MVNYDYELIKIYDKIPAKIIIHDKFQGTVPQHWHEALELTIPISGSITININRTNINIKKNDILLINSGDIHSIDVNSDELVDGITILLSYNFLHTNYEKIDSIKFILKDCKYKEYLKKLCIEIYNIYTLDDIHNNKLLIVNDTMEGKTSEFNYLKTNSILYEILYILLTHFKIEYSKNTTIKSQKYMNRFKRILEYTNANYKEDLSLEIISDQYGLSREHLSRTFKKYIGITFSEYLDNVRLYNAYRDLLNSDYSITEIAFNNGYPNVASFINKFKKIYGKTPYKYKHNR